MASQNEKILRHMKTYGNITAARAMDWYQIYRLAARVAELRAKGHNIVTEMISPQGVRYARYRLVK